MARTILKWSDDDFWDSSPAFLFKQFDIHLKNQEKINKKMNVKNPKKSNNIETKTTTIKKKFKVLDYKGGE